jgi:hypothetical protein
MIEALREGRFRHAQGSILSQAAPIPVGRLAPRAGNF